MPITTKQKFTIARKDTFDYPSYLLAAAFSGLSQLDNSNPSFGQGLKGYARRYASAVADQDIGQFHDGGNLAVDAARRSALFPKSEWIF